MDFGEAIRAMKKGKLVARKGWNGKNMHIYLKDKERQYDSVICMFTAQGTHQPGWLASQADMLGEDWEIVG